MEYLSISIFVYCIMPLLAQKHICNLTFLAALSLFTLFKKFYIITLTILGSSKVTIFMYKIIRGSSCFILPYTRLFQVNYLLLDQFWLIFNNYNSMQYLKNSAILEDYYCQVKYFYD